MFDDCDSAYDKIKRNSNKFDGDMGKIPEKPRQIKEIAQRRIYQVHTGDKHIKNASCSHDKIYFNCSCGAKEAIFLRDVR